MRQKIALVMTFVILSFHINILADTTVHEIEKTDAGTASDAEIQDKAEAEHSDDLEGPIATSSIAERLNETEMIYSVSFPANINAYLDPGNLSGKGQIFSNEYKIENYGNTDVAIKIKNIDIHYSDEKDLYELSENEITDSRSDMKKMNINMVWENKNDQSKKILSVSEGERDEYVIYLKAAIYDENNELVGLDDSGTGYFYFTGTLSSNPNIEWNDGEITARFDYEIVDMEEAAGNTF